MYTANTSTTGNLLTATPTFSDLSPLLGAPNLSFQVPPGFNARQEFATVAGDYAGRVASLGVFVTNMFAETENVWIFGLFELKQLGDQNWQTETWTFDSNLAQSTPSGVPPPLGSFKKTVSTGTLTRYAFGVQTLLDTLKDPQGDMIYKAQTIQCLQGFVRALEAQCLQSLINTRAQYLAFWVEFSDYKIDIASRANTECVTFDAMHRYEDASSRLTDLVQQNFAQAYRGKATAVIVHQGFRSLVSTSPMLTEFYRRGNGNQSFADLKGDSPGLQGTLLGTDIKLYVAAPINATSQGVHKDVLSRTVSIGGWSANDNYDPGHSPEDYKSTFTDVAPFDMRDDNFRTVSLDYALDHCNRFDSSAVGNLVDAHRRLAAEANHIAQQNRLPIHKGVVDMFVYEVQSSTGTSYSNVTHYGHMEPWALTPTIVRNHAHTMRRFLRSKLRDETIRALYDGAELIDRLNSLPISAADIAWAESVAKPSAGVSGGHTTGGPQLPAAAPVGAGANYEPRFFGSAGGLFTLGRIDPAQAAYIAPGVLATSRAFYEAVRAAYNALAEIYGTDHPLLNAAYCPTTFASTLPGDFGAQMRAYMTFAHNVIAGNPQVLLFTADKIVVEAGLIALAGAFADFDTLRSNTTPAVRAVLTSPATVKAFSDKFNDGPMGAAYRKYVAEKGAARRQAAINIGDAFEHFVQFEVKARLDGTDANKTWALNRLLASIISATNRGVEYTFTKESLDALVNRQDYEAHRSTQTAATTSGTFYATRFTASPERIYEYNTNKAANDPVLSLASALDPTRAAGPGYDAALRSQQASSVDDLSGRTVSTLARPTTARPDVRTPYGLAAGTAPFTAFSDIGIDTVTDQYNRSKTKTNTNLVGRVKAVLKETDLLLRIGGLMLVTAPVQKAALKKMYEENIHLPVAALLMRPMRTYRTVAMIWLAADSYVGTAAFALPDVRRNFDAARKSMFDHYSMYLGAIVVDPARVMVMPDVCLVGYEGGETTEPVSPPKLGEEETGSMYVILMPAGSLYGREKTVGAAIDITGRPPRSIEQYNAADRNSANWVQTQAAHYSSALFTSMTYSFDTRLSRTLPAAILFNNEERINTLCLREMAMVNLVPGERIAVTPSDHMGMHVFPGVGKQRTGGSFPEVAHANPNANVKWLPS